MVLFLLGTYFTSPLCLTAGLFGGYFQLTTSRRGRHQVNMYPKWHEHFNSLPHAEVDGVTVNIADLGKAFQLTTSRRGRRCYPSILRLCPLFQLTTSRRGRPIPEICCPYLKHFNSLPHAEVDFHATIPQ